MQKAVWQQQRHTWSLLAVLYAAIQDSSVVHLPDNPTLVDMKRRANLSKWLQVAFARLASTIALVLPFPCGACRAYLGFLTSCRAAASVFYCVPNDIYGNICLPSISQGSTMLKCMFSIGLLGSAGCSKAWHAACDSAQSTRWPPACCPAPVRASDCGSSCSGSFHG